MDLQQVFSDIADGLKSIDASGAPFKNYLPGVGPYGEPQLLKLVCQKLTALPAYSAGVKTMLRYTGD
jgi:hypothetical protein